MRASPAAAPCSRERQQAQEAGPLVHAPSACARSLRLCTLPPLARAATRPQAGLTRTLLTRSRHRLLRVRPPAPFARSRVFRRAVRASASSCDRLCAAERVCRRLCVASACARGKPDAACAGHGRHAASHGWLFRAQRSHHLWRLGAGDFSRASRSAHAPGAPPAGKRTRSRALLDAACASAGAESHRTPVQRVPWATARAVRHLRWYVRPGHSCVSLCSTACVFHACSRLTLLASPVCQATLRLTGSPSRTLLFGASPCAPRATGAECNAA
jgi:hypothetical protein